MLDAFFNMPLGGLRFWAPSPVCDIAENKTVNFKSEASKLIKLELVINGVWPKY